MSACPWSYRSWACEAADEHRRGLPLVLSGAEHRDDVGAFDATRVVFVRRAEHRDTGDGEQAGGDREQGNDDREDRVAADEAHPPNLATGQQPGTCRHPAAKSPAGRGEANAPINRPLASRVRTRRWPVVAGRDPSRRLTSPEPGIEPRTSRPS